MKYIISIMLLLFSTASLSIPIDFDSTKNKTYHKPSHLIPFDSTNQLHTELQDKILFHSCSTELKEYQYFKDISLSYKGDNYFYNSIMNSEINNLNTKLIKCVSNEFKKANIQY